MTFYQRLAAFADRHDVKHHAFKWGFNLSPMYRRSTARLTEVSRDLRLIRIRLPISWRNRNYLGSIFGGSLFAAVDPLPMVQLINLLGDDYVVWDKAATISFRRPAREDLYAEFRYTDAEVEDVRRVIAASRETEIVKTTELTNRDGSVVYCRVEKTIYVAERAFFREKRRKTET